MVYYRAILIYIIIIALHPLLNLPKLSFWDHLGPSRTTQCVGAEEADDSTIETIRILILAWSTGDV